MNRFLSVEVNFDSLFQPYVQEAKQSKYTLFSKKKKKIQFVQKKGHSECTLHNDNKDVIITMTMRCVHWSYANFFGDFHLFSTLRVAVVVVVILFFLFLYLFVLWQVYNNSSTVEKVQTNIPFVPNAMNNELFRFISTFSVITSFTFVIKSHFCDRIISSHLRFLHLFFLAVQRFCSIEVNWWCEFHFNAIEIERE